MAYRIQYTPQEEYRYPMSAKHRKIQWGRLLILIVLFVAGFWLKICGIPDFLIPGDPQVTKTAAIEFMGNMKSGVSMEQAVTTFCRQILDGTQK